MKSEFSPIALLQESRFKWMAGSTAAAVAASSTAIAETVQITQTGNSINANSGILNPDLTGDGTADIPGFTSSPGSGPIVTGGGTLYFNSARATSSAGPFAVAAFSNRVNGGPAFGSTYLASAAGNSSAGPNPKTIRGLHPVVFSDTRINGGAISNGFLDIHSAALSPTSNTVTFVRLVFDDESPTAPSGITAGGTNKKWLTPGERAALISQISKLSRKIKKLKAKAKKAKRAGNFSKAKKLNKKIKKLKKQLSAL